MEWRISVVRPRILEEVKFARSHGDLSENAEYHAAKQERGKNESRIRFLRNMIKTAVIVTDDSPSDVVGLFDTVTFLPQDEDEPETVRLATTMRQDVMENIVSGESPIGKALLGHKVGDTVYIETDGGGYHAVITALVKGKDDDSLAIRSY